jgi:hypothetical protein
VRQRDLGLDLPDMLLVRPTDQALHGLDHVSLLALDLTDQWLGGAWPADIRIDGAGEPVIRVLVLLLDDAGQERGRAHQVASVVPLGNQAVLNRLAGLGHLLQPARHHRAREVHHPVQRLAPAGVRVVSRELGAMEAQVPGIGVILALV